MSYAALLTELDSAIAKRDRRLAGQLRPGLKARGLNRWLKYVTGDATPIIELFSWHDGTEALRWSEGDTHHVSLLELSLVPENLFIFVTLERAVATFRDYAEVAKYHPHAVEAVGRYFPFLGDDSDAWFCIDLKPGQQGRVVYYELQNDQPFQEAYPTFEAFLIDLLRANESGEALQFLDRMR